MANFLGGVIPTVKLSPSTTVNLVATGLIENVSNTAVNVALGAILPDKVGAALGVSPASFNDVLSSAVAPSIIASGQSAISNYLAGSLANSQALGPLGPLVANLANNAVQSLAGGLYGAVTGKSSSNANRWFPGAGDEPDAFYNGNLYTSGPTGSDVVFSIKSAESVAVKEAQEQWFKPNPESIKWSESLKPGNNPFSLGNSPDLLKSGNNLDMFRYPTAATAGTHWYFKQFSEELATYPRTLSIPESAKNSTVRILPPKESWNFICAPEEISWNSDVQAERVQVFGTNHAPVMAGSKGMRELNMSNALVEGFSRGKSVESKIAKLESLMGFSLDTSKSYVKVPVFYVTANDKKYGFGFDGKEGGYYLIKSVAVKEIMRDLKGNTTRGTVDISFIQVPPYQVESGRDIASKPIRGQKSILSSVADRQAASLKGSVAKASGSNTSRGSGSNTSRGSGSNTSGSSVPGASPFVPIP